MENVKEKNLLISGDLFRHAPQDHQPLPPRRRDAKTATVHNPFSAWVQSTYNTTLPVVSAFKNTSPAPAPAPAPSFPYTPITSARAPARSFPYTALTSVPAPAPAPSFPYAPLTSIPAPVSALTRQFPYTPNLEPDPKPTFPYTSPPPSGAFSVLSYNVRCDNAKFPHDWKSRRAHVANVIRDSGASVVCLQESGPHVKKYVLEAMPAGWQCVGAYRNKARPEATHVLFDGNRWDILGTSTFLLSDRMDEFGQHEKHCTGSTEFGGVKAAHPRIVTHVCLKDKAGQGLDVFNTHFPLLASLQVKCAHAVCGIARARTRPGFVPVIAGDFNCHTQEAMDVFWADGWRSVVAPQEHTFAEAFGDECDSTLDHVLVRQGQEASGNVIRYAYGESRVRPSDHDAVCARFEDMMK